MSKIFEHVITAEGKQTLVLHEMAHLTASALTMPEDRPDAIQSDVTFTQPMRPEYLILHLEYITRSGAKALDLDIMQVVAMLINRLTRKEVPTPVKMGETLKPVVEQPLNTAPSAN